MRSSAVIPHRTKGKDHSRDHLLLSLLTGPKGKTTVATRLLLGSSRVSAAWGRDRERGGTTLPLAPLLDMHSVIQQRRPIEDRCQCFETMHPLGRRCARASSRCPPRLIWSTCWLEIGAAVKPSPDWRFRMIENASIAATRYTDSCAVSMESRLDDERLGTVSASVRSVSCPFASNPVSKTQQT